MHRVSTTAAIAIVIALTVLGVLIALGMHQLFGLLGTGAGTPIAFVSCADHGLLPTTPVRRAAALNCIKARFGVLRLHFLNLGPATAILRLPPSMPTVHTGPAPMVAGRTLFNRRSFES
jgi:hypothetical protein